MITEDQKRALRALEDDQGRIDPEDVVAAARDPASPLHERFEWSDATAAHQFRLQVARMLIGGVRIVVTETAIPLEKVRYVRDPNTESRYVNLHVIRNDQETATKVLLTEMHRVKQAARRCRAIASYVGAATEIRDLERLAEDIISSLECPLKEPAPELVEGA